MKRRSIFVSMYVLAKINIHRGVGDRSSYPLLYRQIDSFVVHEMIELVFDVFTEFIYNVGIIDKDRQALLFAPIKG